MELDHQKIKIELNKKYIEHTAIVAHQGDVGTRYIDIEFYNNGKIVDLTDCTIMANLVSAKSKVLLATDIVCTVDITNTIATLKLEPNSLYGEKVYCEVFIMEVISNSPTGKYVYSPAYFEISVGKSLLNDSIISDQPINSIAQIIEEIVTARSTYNSLGERLNAIEDNVTENVERLNAIEDNVTENVEIEVTSESNILYNNYTTRQNICFSGSDFSPILLLVYPMAENNICQTRIREGVLSTRQKISGVWTQWSSVDNFATKEYVDNAINTAITTALGGSY